jgi:hypothetical protein
MMASSPGGIMRAKMTHAMRTEFAEAIQGRYAAAAIKDKRRILEEFVVATEYHEKSSIRVRSRSAGIPSLYDEAVRGGLWIETTEGAKFWRRSSTTCARHA